MENSGSLLVRMLVVLVLGAVVQPGAATQKLATCCKTVDREEITDPILGFLVQKADPPCVQAIIFQTKTGLFCSQLNAPWVLRKISAFRKARAQETLSVVPSSKVSLLSIITSTASPPSSSTPPPSSSFSSSFSPSSSLPITSSTFPSFASTSEMPADETFSEDKEELLLEASGHLSVYEALQRGTETTSFICTPLNLIFNRKPFWKMVNSREMVKSTFVALVLVAVIHSVSAAEKLASCCKTVTKLKITEPITGYMIQRPKPPCVLAVIFQTQSGLYCIHLRAPWVRQEIAAIERAKAQAISSSVVPSSAPSLLSIITSTASRPASSTPLPSSSPLSSSYPSSSSTPLSFSSLPSSSSPLASSSPTSSSSTPLSSSSPASFAPTSEMPADETFSEDQDE
ncbi:uncharacterized protein [Labrus bergylta]|uniref:uncharacterized protein n=1 Tax=Labrus bergylta TaxID=56723 RepID=UPI0033134353